MIKKLFRHKKLRSYFIASLSVSILFIVTAFLISTSIRSYFENRILDEAVNLSESNNFALQSLIESSEVVESLLEERLETGSRIIESHLLNGTKIPIVEIIEDLELDEVNIFDTQLNVVNSTIGHEGFLLPKQHPISSFAQSTERTYIEEIRRDYVSGVFYKYAYFKLENDYIVQLGITSDRISEYTQNMSAEEHLDALEQKDFILKANLVLEDKALSPILDYVPKVFLMDEYEKEHYLSEEMLYRNTTIHGEDAIEVLTPIILDGEVKGTLFIFYSLKTTQNLTTYLHLSILVLFTLISLIFVLLVWTLYFKDRHLDHVIKHDEETNMFNRTAFFEMIAPQLSNDRLKGSAVVIFVLENLSKLRLVHNYELLYALLNGFSDKLSQLYSEDVYRYSENAIIIQVHDFESKKDIISRVEETVLALLEEDLLNLGANISSGVLIFNDENTENILVISQNIELAIIDLETHPAEHTRTFDDNLLEQILYMERIETDLRQLTNISYDKQMYVAFQPQIDSKTKAVVGFEALSRWNHPELGYISPQTIYEIAERSDLILSLSHWVLIVSAQFTKDLVDLGINDIIVSVNVSIAQLNQQDFVKVYKQVIDEYNIPAQLLAIEITETVLEDNIDKLSETIMELRLMGVKVSLDDFGTGYASMALLKGLQIDTLKIDKSFIDTMEEEKVIINGIVSMAHQLNLEIVAEGVETKSQYEILREMSVQIIQGYYFSKPLEKEAAIAFAIKSHKTKGVKDDK